MNLVRCRRGILCLVILALAVSTSCARLLAQSSTEGSIAGTVTDPSGAVVKAAAITIHNNATNAEVKLSADESGYFKAPLLEPGTYTVTLTANGFATYDAKNVVVVVGQVTGIEPHLALASSASTVEVTEETPVLNHESPDFSSTLNSTALSSIPINNRRWSSLALTTPGVVSDSNGYGLVSVRGISTLLNNVEIDGADDNQAFFAEERGRTREAYSTSGSAVREFAVNTGVYSAEYGRAAGGVITSVTKSGTNQLHGQAYFWDRESNWAAFNDYTKITNSADVTSAIKPEDLRKIYGFTVGGPLIKNKLFGIYTFDQHTHVFPVIGVPDNQTNFNTMPSATLASGETCAANGYLTGAPAGAVNDAYACTLAARQGISYAQAAADWNSMIFGGPLSGGTTVPELGLNSDIGQVSRFGYQEINTPKLDWQVNDKHQVSVLYHRLRWDSPGGVQTSASDHYARDTQGNDFVKLDYGVVKLTSLVTPHISNELLYQYGRELDDEGQQQFTPFTTQNLVGTGGNIPEVAIATSNAGFYAGSPYYSHRIAYPSENKWQIGDIVYFNHGNHSFKFGVDAVHNYDLQNDIYEGNGYFSYTYLGNFINDELNFLNGVVPSATNPRGCNSSSSSSATSGTATVTGADSCYSSYSQGFGIPAYAISTMDTGLFAQDNWKFSPRLSFELGLRWDYESFPSADSNLTTATGTGTFAGTTSAWAPYNGLDNNPSDKINFGPRVGFSYDLLGSGNTVLRGGYGLYYGRVTNGNLLNARLNTGSPLGQTSPTFKNNTTPGPVFPNVFSATGVVPTPSSYFLAPNLKNPEVQEFDLMLQQSLGHGTFVQGSYLGALGRRLPNYLDVNLDPGTVENVTITIADASGLGPLANGTTYTVPTYTSYGNTALLGPNAAGYSSITELVSNVNSSYNAFVVEVLNRSLHSIQFDANYTWSHALDFAQNTDTEGTTNGWYDPYSDPRINYGNSSFNVPNRFVAYALYNFPNLHTGNWVKYLTNDWNLDDSFQVQNGLPYTAGVSEFAGVAVGSDWNGSSGSSLIPAIGPETQKYPRKIVDDARLQKNIPFEGGRELQLIANVFNIANHQNIDGLGTTAYELSGSGTTATATYQGQPGTANDTYKVPTSSNSSGFLYTPREVEISARFTF